MIETANNQLLHMLLDPPFIRLSLKKIYNNEKQLNKRKFIAKRCVWYDDSLDQSVVGVQLVVQVVQTMTIGG